MYSRSPTADYFCLLSWVASLWFLTRCQEVAFPHWEASYVSVLRRRPARGSAGLEESADQPGRLESDTTLERCPCVLILESNIVDGLPGFRSPGKQRTKTLSNVDRWTDWNDFL